MEMRDDVLTKCVSLTADWCSFPLLPNTHGVEVHSFPLKNSHVAKTKSGVQNIFHINALPFATFKPLSAEFRCSALQVSIMK